VEIEEITTEITAVHVDVYIDGKLVIPKDGDSALDIRQYLLEDVRHDSRNGWSKIAFLYHKMRAIWRRLCRV